MDGLKLANGTVEVDLWTINDKSATLISTLSLDDTKQLAKWLLNYLAKYDKH